MFDCRRRVEELRSEGEELDKFDYFGRPSLRYSSRSLGWVHCYSTNQNALNESAVPMVQFGKCSRIEGDIYVIVSSV